MGIEIHRPQGNDLSVLTVHSATNSLVTFLSLLQQIFPHQKLNPSIDPSFLLDEAINELQHFPDTHISVATWYALYLNSKSLNPVHDTTHHVNTVGI